MPPAAEAATDNSAIAPSAKHRSTTEAGLRRENAGLRAELAELSQQILRARDAVVGAEAELGVAKARVVEVEHHLHVQVAEVEELRAKVLELSAAAEANAGRSERADRPNPVARRLSPLLARTANLTK